MDLVDLHCDLLEFLTHQFEPDDPNSRASLPQMKQGGINLQTLAFFTETKPGSTDDFNRQIEAYLKLSKLAHPFKSLDQVNLDNQDLCLLPAIENASGFLEEDEPLDLFFKRFEAFEKKVGQPLYLSLTWNQENRFGGGNLTSIGLKEDGVEVLSFLAEKKTALDFSHTSDQLAYDIFNYLAKKSSNQPVLASHSNFREVFSHPRNLPDEFAIEIFERKGIIGMNFVSKFIGHHFQDLISHMKHAQELKIEKALCFGADFYGNHLKIAGLDEIPFFPDYDNSSCYPKVLQLLKKAFDEKFILDLFNQSFFRYLKNHGFISG